MPPVKKALNPTDVRVGSRVRMRRLMLSMSQGKLAEGLGLTFQQIQKYEKGVNRIGASRLARLCTLLAVPPSFFFDETTLDENGGHVAIENIESFFATSDGLALAKSFMKIKSKGARSAIVTLVEELAKAEIKAL